MRSYSDIVKNNADATRATATPVNRRAVFHCSRLPCGTATCDRKVPRDPTGALNCGVENICKRGAQGGSIAHNAGSGALALAKVRVRDRPSDRESVPQRLMLLIKAPFPVAYSGWVTPAELEWPILAMRRRATVGRSFHGHP